MVSDKFKMVAVYLPLYRFINSLEGNTLIVLLQVQIVACGFILRKWLRSRLAGYAAPGAA